MNETTKTAYLVLGAGPAGLQLAYFLDRAGRDYLVLDARERPGTFFETFPRHRKMLSINKVHCGYEEREAQLRYDWNSLLCDDDDFAFTSYSQDYYPDASDFARYLREYARRFRLNIRFDTRVASIHRDPSPDGPFVATDESGRRYVCDRLIVATGLSQPHIPDIPGIELTENYFEFSIDPKDYVGQRVLVIGKGNSAFETANHLTHVTRVTHLCSPHPVKLAWNTHFFGHLRAVNNEFLDTYILKGQNSVLDATIEKIERVEGEFHVSVRYSHAGGQRSVFAYDRVLTCAGFRWDPSPFAPDCAPQLACEDRLPAMTSAWESTNVAGLYFAGTLMQVRDLHKTMSNVLHGLRFNVKSLANVLAQRHEGEEWPYEKLPICAERLADRVIERVSSNAGLMHQPGFLCDLIVVSKEERAIRYHDCLAVDYVHDGELGRSGHYYVVTMEYGHFDGDVFSQEREPDPAKAYDDAYLHPRIQRFTGPTAIDEHHMSESLENDWRPDSHPGERPLIREVGLIGQDDPKDFQATHRRKLVEFFRKHLAG